MSPEHAADLVKLKLTDPDAWALVELAEGYLAVSSPAEIPSELVIAPSNKAWDVFRDWSVPDAYDDYIKCKPFGVEDVCLAALFAAWSLNDLEPRR